MSAKIDIQKPAGKLGVMTVGMGAVATTFIGLVPLLWATGAGADTMRRLAAPMIGGLATSFTMELMIYPVIFFFAKQFEMWRDERRTM